MCVFGEFTVLLRGEGKGQGVVQALIFPGTWNGIVDEVEKCLISSPSSFFVV